MNRMKKLLILLLCLCTVLTAAAVTASAALSGATLKIDAPEAGAKPASTATVSLGRVDVKSVRWEGKLDGAGAFIAAEDYTVILDITPKDGDSFKTDGFAVTLNDDDMTVVSNTGKAAQLKYTFYSSASDFAPNEYGTARARYSLKVLSQTTPKKYTGEVIKQGETVKVVRAYAEKGSYSGSHMIELNGKICYIEAFKTKTPTQPSLFAAKAEGKLDPNNIPAHLVPNNHVAAPERIPQTVKSVQIRKLEAVVGKAPVLETFNASFYQMESVKYSSNPVKGPYTIFTADVTFAVKNQADSFAKDVTSEYNGVILSNTGKKLVVRYSTIATNGETYASITQEMKDVNEYWKLHAASREPYYHIGKRINFHSDIYAYEYPMMVGDKTVLPEEFPITDLEVSKKISGVTGTWYRIIIGPKYYYIPASYVANIREYNGYWQDTPPAQMVVTPYTFAGGTGTLSDPYLVKTAEQLNAIRFGLDKHYRLVSDIDLSSWGNWIPIGGTPAYGGDNGNPNMAHNGAGAFTGSLDGNGYVISGMQIVIDEKTPYLTEKGNTRYYGLFSRVGTAPDAHTIRNLGIVNFKIHVKYSAVTERLDLYAGAIAGYNACLNAINCYSAGGSIQLDLTHAPNAGMFYVHAGGLFGDGGGLATTRKTYLHIEKCFNLSPVTVNVHNAPEQAPNYVQISGIMAAIDSTHIYECWNGANITAPIISDGTWSSYVASGITSFAAIPDIPGIYHRPTDGASYLLNCYNTGAITGNSTSGVFGYSASDIHLRNCYNVGKLTHNTAHNEAYGTIGQYILPHSNVVDYGTEFINNCYGNGTSVSGEKWKSSASLGRMILTSVPEDSFKIPSVEAQPSIICGFLDVKANAWYADAVRWAVDTGVTSGTSRSAFSPAATCTRGQVVTFLWRALGKPEPKTTQNPFTDVKTSDYFYKPVLWAVETGITNGTGATTFSPNATCTSGQVVTFLYRSNNPGAAKEASNPYYANAVKWAEGKKLLSGTGVAFAPANNAPRSDIVYYLYRNSK